MAPKKAQMSFQDMLPIGMTFVILTIGLAIGLQVTGDVSHEMCETGYNATSSSCNTNDELSLEYNASVKGIEGLAKLPNKLPIIATVIVASILIGILIRNLVRSV